MQWFLNCVYKFVAFYLVFVKLCSRTEIILIVELRVLVRITLVRLSIRNQLLSIINHSQLFIFAVSETSINRDRSAAVLQTKARELREETGQQGERSHSLSSSC